MEQFSFGDIKPILKDIEVFRFFVFVWFSFCKHCIIWNYFCENKNSTGFNWTYFKYRHLKHSNEKLCKKTKPKTTTSSWQNVLTKCISRCIALYILSCLYFSQSDIIFPCPSLALENIVKPCLLRLYSETKSPTPPFLYFMLWLSYAFFLDYALKSSVQMKQ